jgi:hypothetical protein
LFDWEDGKCKDPNVSAVKYMKDCKKDFATHFGKSEAEYIKKKDYFVKNVQNKDLTKTDGFVAGKTLAGIPKEDIRQAAAWINTKRCSDEPLSID